MATTQMVSLRDLTSFGDVAAEDDAVLDYFLTTDAVTRIKTGDVFLVLGRKGAGKTALVRHFAEGSERVMSRSLNLGGYPWAVHAQRVDRGASDVEAYVSSWRYLIAGAARGTGAHARPRSQRSRRQSHPPFPARQLRKRRSPARRGPETERAQAFQSVI
jgi:hypothetical protein